MANPEVDMDESKLAAAVEQIQRLVDLLLRYVVAGGAALLVFGYLQAANFAFLRVGQSSDISLYITTLVVVVCGVTIYTVHRGLLYRPLLSAQMNLSIHKHRLPLSAKGLDDILTDNRIRRKADAAEKPLQNHFDRWAAEVHLLYSSAWGGSLATALAFANGYKSSFSVALFIGMVVLLLFGSAFWHDRHMMEDEIRNARGLPKRAA